MADYDKPEIRWITPKAPHWLWHREPPAKEEGYAVIVKRIPPAGPVYIPCNHCKGPRTEDDLGYGQCTSCRNTMVGSL